MKALLVGRSAIESTVLEIAGILARNRRPPLLDDERMLRQELVACILSSRVRAESANQCVDRLAVAGLLDDERWADADADFEGAVYQVLSARVDARGVRQAAYRFPREAALRIASLRSALQCRLLMDRLSRQRDPRVTREELVRDLPGVGPKQASMFLRNVGVTLEVAVLDVHVLRYLSLIGLVNSKTVSVPSLAAYEVLEMRVFEYADGVGCSPGLLDWAIWVTMRALAELEQ